MLSLEELLSIDFGLLGNDSHYLDNGWSIPEQGSRWSVGARSRIFLPAPTAPGNYRLLFTVVPYIHPQGPWSQRLSILVNGMPVREGRWNTLTVLACRVPHDHSSGDRLEITLEHPDAVRPNEVGASLDERPLAFAVSNVKLFSVGESRTTETAAERNRREPMPAEREYQQPRQDGLPPDRDLLLRFASLGDNCELGIVQRQLQADALDLFRFAAIPLPALLTALRTGLAGIDAPELIEIQLRGSEAPREFIFRHAGIGMESHTLVLEGQQPGHRIFVREQRRVSFLGRMLLKDLQLGRRIFVIKRNIAMQLGEVMPLLELLRQYGPNTLLWLEEAGNGRSPGTVEVLRAGLMKGYVERFAPYDKADGAEASVWLPVCRQAYSAWAAMGELRGGAAPPTRIAAP